MGSMINLKRKRFPAHVETNLLTLKLKQLKQVRNLTILSSTAMVTCTYYRTLI